MGFSRMLLFSSKDGQSSVEIFEGCIDGVAVRMICSGSGLGRYLLALSLSCPLLLAFLVFIVDLRVWRGEHFEKS